MKKMALFLLSFFLFPIFFSYIKLFLARFDIYFSFRFLVRVSYLEIYNENVRDLLGKDQNAKLEVCCLCC